MAGMGRDGKGREGFFVLFMAGYVFQWAVNGLVGGILCC